MTDSKGQRLIVLGRITGLFGVQGWLKIFSETDPREAILTYSPWLIRQGDNDWGEVAVLRGRRHGKTVVAQLAAVTDRDQAASFLGAEIAVRRDQLPPAAESDFYWTDLEGLLVKTTEDTVLGTLQSLFATGANDVMVIVGERERLVPFILEQVVKYVDLDAGVIVVDWDPEF